MSGDLQCLSGKTALVFGGTSGIGLACVKAYAGAGARSIMIVGRNRERGEAALSDLRALFGNTEFDLAVADASTFSNAEKMATLGVVEPEDLAALAVYLSSPAAAKLSGQAISLNGGISMA